MKPVATDCAATTKPIVLLHGWGMLPTVWTEVIAKLGPQRPLLCPTLPGHDGKPPPPTLDAWADALVDRHAAVFKDAAHEGVVLVGWSLGAMLALAIAQRHSDQVARLVLLGASPRFVAQPDWPHGLAAATVDAFVRGFADDPATTLKRFAALQVLGDAGGRRLTRQLAEHFALPLDADRNADTIAALATGLEVLASADLRPALHSVQQPCLLIHGETDALMPVAAAHWLAEQLPDARLHLRAATGHALPLAASVECARRIAAFVDGADAVDG